MQRSIVGQLLADIEQWTDGPQDPIIKNVAALTYQGSFLVSHLLHWRPTNPSSSAELTFWLFLLHQGPHKRNWFQSWEFRAWYLGVSRC